MEIAAHLLFQEVLSDHSPHPAQTSVHAEIQILQKITDKMTIWIVIGQSMLSGILRKVTGCSRAIILVTGINIDMSLKPDSYHSETTSN